jgi:hypothetical protein
LPEIFRCGWKFSGHSAQPLPPPPHFCQQTCLCGTCIQLLWSNTT